jgi:hypothetical protein
MAKNITAGGHFVGSGGTRRGSGVLIPPPPSGLSMEIEGLLKPASDLDCPLMMLS